MCAIAVILGQGADRGAFRAMIGSMAPRGEVGEMKMLLDDALLAGTQRLPIVDRGRAVQPWLSADGRWLLCYNGEVFNHRQLHAELDGLGHAFRSEGDTEVVLEAFLEWGDGAVGRLHGEFAFTIADRLAGTVYVARDPVGVKPLYWSRLGGRLHVASEVKALVPVGAPVAELPPGHHGWASATAGPDPRPYLDLTRLGENQPPIEDPETAAKLIRAAIADSVRVRVDTDLTVGVLLSGGLDSSLILLHALRAHPDCVAFTVGAPGSDDIRYARRLTAELGVPHEVIELRPRDIRLAQIREAILVCELTGYRDIVNAVVSVPLLRRIHECGVKVVLSGDGSDELFGGYPMHDEVGMAESRPLQVIRNLCRTELQRLDRVSMGQSVEPRVPFLDPSLVELAMRLPAGLKMRDGREKWIIRQAFTDLLPGYISHRPKDMLSYSTGLGDRARLFKPLLGKLYRSFGYDLLDPARSRWPG